MKKMEQKGTRYRMSKIWKGLLAAGGFLSSVAFFFSCSNDACRESMYTPVQVNFYQKETPASAYLFQALTVYNVNGRDIVPTEYADTTGGPTFMLELDATGSVSKYFFKSDNWRDTLVIEHTNTLEFVSAECGTRLVSHVDSVYFSNGGGLDSIDIFNPTVKGGYNAKNIQVYID